ncbi:MAG: hypothetical protein AAF429_04395 [Pseudomonadota bacterium]
MADFKLGTVEFNVDAFAIFASNYSSLAAHLFHNEQIEVFRHNCERPISRRRLPFADIGANLTFVEDKFRLKGFRKKFDRRKLGKTKQAKFVLSKAKLKKEFYAASGLTKEKLKEELAKHFTPLHAEFPESYVKALVPKYCFVARLSVMNRIVLGRAKGPNFDIYFEMSYPLHASWHLDKIDDCNPMNDEQSYTYPYEKYETGIPYRREEFAKLGEKKETQKEIEKKYQRFRKSLKEFWQSDEIAEKLKQKFKQDLEGE